MQCFTSGNFKRSLFTISIPTDRSSSWLLHAVIYGICLVDIWELIGTSAERDYVDRHGKTYNYSQVDFTIYLDRKPRFYIVNIVIPVVFLVFVVFMVSQLVVYQSVFCVKSL